MSELEITVDKNADQALITLAGRLDTNTAPEFEAVTSDVLAEGITNIAVDMGAVSYVSSAGLRVIIALQKALLAKGDVVFRHVQPEVKEVFDMTGFSSILRFE